MRKLVLTLSIAATGFAATAAYFALELNAARAELAAVRSTSPRSSPVTVVAAASVAPRPPAATGAGPNQQSPPSNVMVLSIDGPEQREHSRSFLEAYRDPAGYQNLFKDRLRMLRPIYADLGRTLGLKNEDADQLIELLVRQQLATEEAASKCLAEPSCNYTGVAPDLAGAQEREIAGRFGTETLDALRFYERSHNERQTVTELRGRLPDSARLSDAKARELVHALTEENASIQEDMAKVNYGIAQSNSGAFVSMEADDTGAREAAAAEYNRRMLDRAAGVLSAEQLAVYQQMIDTAVEESRNFRSLPSAAIREVPQK